MEQTPLWLPLVVAIVGLVGTVAGVVLTQRRSDRREREAREAERAWERERWARDDHLRTFEHRREEYVSMLAALDKLLWDPAVAKKEPVSSEWTRPAWDAWRKVRLYGMEEVIDAAWTALGELTGLGEYSDQRGPQRRKALEAMAALEGAIRADLGMPADSRQPYGYPGM